MNNTYGMIIEEKIKSHKKMVKKELLKYQENLLHKAFKGDINSALEYLSNDLKFDLNNKNKWD